MRRYGTSSYRKNSFFLSRLLLVLLIITISALASIIVYLKVVSNKCIDSFTLASYVKLDGSNLILNDNTIDITSPLLMVREYSEDSKGFMSKLTKSKSSNITELLYASKNRKVNFGKSGTILMFQVCDDEYNNYSSSSLKVRYSDFNDGYLLEINNKTNSPIKLFYNSNGEVFKDSIDNNPSMNLRPGLNQLSIPSTVNIDNLSKNLINYSK